MSKPTQPPPHRLLDAWIRRDAVQVLAQLLIVLIVVGGIGTIVNRMTPILAPLLVSMLLAYFLDPLIDWFEARKVSRTLAIVFVGGLVIGLTIEFFVVVLPTFVSAIAGALEDLPTQFAQRFERFLEAVEGYGVTEEQLTEPLSQVAGHAQRMLSQAGSVVFGLAASLLNLVLIPVFTFYFLRDFDKIKVLPMRLVPPRYHEKVLDRARSMDTVVGHWLRGQIQVGLVLAVLYAIGLAAINLKLGVVIGLVAGVLNVVPYFGLFVGLSLAMVMGLTQDASYLIAVPAVFGIVQALEQYVITPKLIGDKVGLSPVMVMAVLLVGGSAFGFFGLVLSIPVFAAARVLWDDVLELYESTPWWGDDPAPDGQGATAAIEADPQEGEGSTEQGAATDVTEEGEGDSSGAAKGDEEEA